MPHYIYMLICADDTYYVGLTTDLERRLEEHQSGSIKGYTRSRRPVQLVWSAEVPTQNDAFLLERQIKGWSRAKKEALVRRDWDELHEIVARQRRDQDRKKRSRSDTKDSNGAHGSS